MERIPHPAGAPGAAPAAVSAARRKKAPRMTLPRALRAALRRLARSSLAPVHLACGLAGGAACGAYFAAAPWDPALGADAFAQFLGALIPLMAGIACGLAIDEEQRAGRLANLVGVPSRGRAALGFFAALSLMGAGALAMAFGTFAGILAAAGRLTVEAGPLVAAWAGCVLGSLPLYALLIGLAARFGRNAVIGVGAAGLILAFFSVGGLAHGLMTGTLTGVAPAGLLGAIPFSWPARLASLAIELDIARGAGDAAQLTDIAGTGTALAVAALALAVLGAGALAAWFTRYEERRD